MKRLEMSATGIISSSGKLQMFMGELNGFFAQHKGERVVARFLVAPRASSAALRGYYFNYIVPMCRAAFRELGERMDEEEVEKRLREMSPEARVKVPDENTGEYNCCLKTIAEMSNAELLEHIDFIRQYAAENLYVFIDDPYTL